jgi:hypothetical protein
MPNSFHAAMLYAPLTLEQDHRAIQASDQREPAFPLVLVCVAHHRRYEAIQMIRKGQAYRSAAGAKIGLLHRFILDLFAATN